MVRRDWIIQRLGTLEPLVCASDEISESDALTELAVLLTDFNASVSAEESIEGYDIRVDTALEECVVFRV